MIRMSEMIMIVCVFFVACFPNTDPLEDSMESIAEVENSLFSYYDAFEAEAAKRGLVINLDDYNLESHIAEIHEDGIAGTCQYNSHASNVVTIDLQFWNDASEASREMVVFHELGHCVLYQGHREAANNEGACLSLMNSGTAGCQVYYSEENREYYLDELFSFSQMVALNN